MASWTDNPATSNTHIRSVHINELRTTIDADRTAAGLTPYSWTDNPVSTATHIRAVHFGEVRTAIRELWFLKRLGPLPNWSVGTPPSPRRQISARDINDLRGWVDQYEGSPNPPDPQGIVSFCYDPTANNGNGAGVSDQFCQDVVNLKPSGDRLLIRTRLVADSTNGMPISQLVTALGTWAENGFGSVAGILTGDTDRNTTQFCANDVLGYQGDPLLNAYIADFANRAGTFPNALGMRTFWVWNEPNIAGIINPGDNCGPNRSSALAPEVFGAMLYKTATALKQGGALAVYAGSLSMLPGTDPTGAEGAQYLDRLFQYLQAQGVQPPYPWDAWSLNIEGYPTESFLADVFLALVDKLDQYGDYAPLIIGEWGTADSAYNFASAQASFNALRHFFSTMYFYVHPFDPGTGFGASNWSDTTGQFMTTGPLSWYSGLQALYQSQ